jgi:LysM repeat protein
VAAPLAFLVLATLGVVAVRAALEEEDSAAPATVTVTTAAGTTQPEQPAAGTTTNSRGQFYRVQSGDTLESIAEEHGTTVEALLELNPGIDPVALRIGQRIRVG